MIVEISCPICDSSRYSFFLNVQGVDGQAYQIYRCSNCSHRYVSPPPDQAILEKAYDAFQSGMYLDMATGNYHEWYKAAIEDAKSEICFIFSLFMTPDLKTAKLKILDYGAGVGCFSYAADKLGLVPLAVDVDKHSLQIAADQGIKTHHVSFPLMAENLPEGSWDIVAMREVIEHMTDPVRDVSMLSRLLKKNGLLVGHVPNASGIESMLLGRRWRSIIPPIHLQYFTERSFREFLRRVGFEPVFLGVLPTLASPNITFGMRNSIRRLMTRLDNPLIRIFGLKIINFLVWIKRYIVYRPLGFFLVKINRFGKGIFFVAKPIGDSGNNSKKLKVKERTDIA